MGTPVKMREREEQCIGAGEPTSRPMTEEELRKYYTEEEIEDMGKKITPPEKEKLIETLAEKKGKTNAVYHASKTFKASAPLIYGWIKDYDIKFDAAGMVIREPEEASVEELDKAFNAISDVITDNAEAIQAGAVIIPKGGITIEDAELGIVRVVTKDEIKIEGNTITITGQETTKKYYKVGYAEYDIGKAFIQIDFRKEIVNFSEGMSFDEAEAAIELLSEIL
jgi:hypothetical protein